MDYQTHNLPSIVMKITEAIYELPFFLIIAQQVFVHDFGHFFGVIGFLRRFAVVNTASGDANPVDNRRDSQNIPPSRSRRGNPRQLQTKFYRRVVTAAHTRQYTQRCSNYPNGSNQYTIYVLPVKHRIIFLYRYKYTQFYRHIFDHSRIKIG